MTASLNSILSGLDLLVLDLGQTTIHNNICLGTMVRFANNADAEVVNTRIKSVTDSIKTWGKQLKLKVRVKPIPTDDYQDWVQRQGRARHILTLLAKEITPEQVASISGLCSERGLSIDNITRLSGRIPLEEMPKPVYACVEFSVRGQTSRDELYTNLLQVAQDNNMDISVQEDNLYRRNRRLVVLDMDSTLITGEVIDELAARAGVGDEVARITELAMQGKMDFRESLSQRVRLLRGLSVDCFEEIAQGLQTNEGVEKFIATLNHLGLKSAIVSGGFGYFARHLKQRLNIDYAYANELIVKDGVLTGSIRGAIVDADAKVRYMQQLCERNHWNLDQAIAIGDGANDIPMLSQAGLGIAFRAKPLVRELAEHSLTDLGMDAILYLLGLRDQDYQLKT